MGDFHSIYLENVNGNHYDVTVCVHQPELQTCYGHCKRTSYSTGYSVRSQSKHLNHKQLDEESMQMHTEKQTLKTMQNTCCVAARN